MGLLEKFFPRKKNEQPEKKPVMDAPKPAPVPKQDLVDPSLPKPGEPVRDMPATATRDLLIELWTSYAMSDNRIKKCIDLQPAVSEWSDAEKSFYYLILGNCIGARSNWKDDRRFPFFAASVFYNPINTNSAWHDLHGMYEELSPATAQKLFVKYPLPKDFSDLMNPR